MYPPLLLTRKNSTRVFFCLSDSVYTETERQIMQQLWQLLRWPSEIPYPSSHDKKRKRRDGNQTRKKQSEFLV